MQSMGDQLQAAIAKAPGSALDIAKQFGATPITVKDAEANAPIPTLGVSPEIEGALGQLKPNDVSPVLLLPANRLAVVVLNNRIPTRLAELPEVESKVKDKLLSQKADGVATQKAIEAVGKIRGGEDMAKVAKSMGLTVTESIEFTRSDSVEGLGDAVQIMDAFTKPIGTVIGPINQPGPGAIGGMPFNVVYQIVDQSHVDPSKLSNERAMILGAAQKGQGKEGAAADDRFGIPAACRRQEGHRKQRRSQAVDGDPPLNRMVHSLLDVWRSLTDPERLIHLLSQVITGWLGYALLAGVVFAETGLLVGLFLPGDSLLFTVGVVCGAGELNIVSVCALLTVMSIIGDQSGYFIGYRTGPSIFKRKDSLLFKQEYVHRTQAFYEKHGGKTLIYAKFVPIVRTFAPFMAGVGQMRYTRFLGFNVVGGVLWVLSATLAGRGIGHHAAGCRRVRPGDERGGRARPGGASSRLAVRGAVRRGAGGRHGRERDHACGQQAPGRGHRQPQPCPGCPAGPARPGDGRHRRGPPGDGGTVIGARPRADRCHRARLLRTGLELVIE